MGIIGELFIVLGIKGSDKTIGVLGEIKKGLGETRDMSLEAKAAIVGAVYALERLTATSGAMGTNLTNFNALTGISTKRLQEYQYAGRQVGVTNEDMAASMKSLQSAMGTVARGEGAPAGMKFISGLVGGFDVSRIKDIGYVMQKLQTFATNPNVDAAQKRWALSTFGIGEGVSAGLSRGAFSENAFKHAPSYSEAQLKALAAADRAWSNLGTTIEMAFGKFNAGHGIQLVQDITKITVSVIKLVEELVKLSENIGVFTAIEDITKTIASIFQFVNNAGDTKNQKAFMEAMGVGAPGDTKQTRKWQAAFDTSSAIAPNVNRFQNLGSAQNIEANINMHFQHDGRDHLKTVESVKQAVKQSYRQMSSQLQGS